MAENQLRRIEVDFGDDDPFAELKQIMGLEQPDAVAKAVEAPKASEPVRSTVPEAPKAFASQPAPASDDFTIDLEEELLAGFRSDLDAPAAAPAATPSIDLDAWVAESFTPAAKPAVSPQPAVQPVAVEPMVVEPVHDASAEPVLDELDMGDFDDVFSAALDAAAPAQVDFVAAPMQPVGRLATVELVAPVAHPPAAPVVSRMPVEAEEAAFDFAPEPVAAETGDPVAGDELEAALAAEFEQDLAAEARPADIPPHAGPADDFSFPAEDADAFDASLTAAFERDLAIEPPAAEVASQPAHARPAEPVESKFDLVEDKFDTVESQFELAEGDFDLVAQQRDPAEARLDQPTAEPELDPVELAFDPAELAFDPVELQFDHDELMRDLDDVLAALPDTKPAQPEAAVAAADPVQQEIDLDFDVAMAEVDMEFGSDEPFVDYAPEPVAEEQQELQPADEPLVADLELHDFAADELTPRSSYEPENAADDQRYAAYDHDFAAPVAAAAEAAPAAEPELSFEDELKALLGRPIEPAVLTSEYDTRPLATASPFDDAEAAADHGGGADWGADADGRALEAKDGHDERQSQIDAEFESILSSMANPTAKPAAETAAAPADEAPVFDDHAFDAAFENALAGTGGEDDHEAVAPAMAAPASDLGREIETYYKQGQGTFNKHGQVGQPAPSRSNGAYADMAPQVETIDVPEAGVAVTDELDIPELAYEDDVRPAFDDFEPDFSDIFNEPAEPARTAAAAPKGTGQRLRADVAEYERALATTAAATAAINAARQPAEWEPDYAPHASDANQGRAPMQAPEFDDFDMLEDRLQEAVAYDDQDPADYADPATYDDSLGYADPAAYEMQDPVEPAPARRGYMIAAVVGGIALLGAAGAFALSFNGDSATNGPAVVRADPDPIKVRPENPGGATAPNADNKVFESMAGAADTTSPAQEKLIPSSEEPVDLTARTIELAPVEDEVEAAEPVAEAETVAEAPAVPAVATELPAATGKAEDRVTPSEERSADAMEVAAVQPRKVKTLVVRSDGTLVPREEPTEAAPVAVEATEPTALAPVKPLVETPSEKAAPAIAALEPAKPAETAKPETAKPVEVAEPAEPVAEKPAESATPALGPVADARPSDQPVDIVGEVAPERVATVAPAGGWSVQIASQPSEEAARSTYADLSRRYANVIGGKAASIVKADIPNKGTFWRVRIAADSRADAIGLCESYKSAGGNCFVSK